MNIKSITESGLCSACGACYSICPKKAIEMVESKAGFIRAEIDEKKCVDCGLCEKVCPSNSTISRNFEGNLITGNIINCYIGYASDKKLRENGQSGGVLSALLMYMLDNGIIKAAIGAGFDGEDNRPHPIYLSTKDDILKNGGSMYTQTPILSKITNVEAPYAIITLGCQSEALKSMKGGNISQPEYIFGLFCEGQYSGKMIDFLADIKSGDHLKTFKFRDKRHGAWPGNVYYKKHDSDYVKDKKIRNSVKNTYECHRCIFCHDLLNKNADIVFGDPWGVPRELCIEKEKGNTVLFSRTKNGQTLIENAIAGGYIVCNEISPQFTIDCQVGNEYQAKIKYAEKWGSENQSYPYCEKIRKEIEKIDVAQVKMTGKSIYERLNFTYRLQDIDNTEEVDRVIEKSRQSEILNYYLKNYANTIKVIARQLKRKLMRGIR